MIFKFQVNIGNLFYRMPLFLNFYVFYTCISLIAVSIGRELSNK